MRSPRRFFGIDLSFIIFSVLLHFILFHYAEMKLTDMFEMVTKDQNFFLLSAENNVLLTTSDEPICVPLEMKTHLHNLRAWADEAAAAGDFGKAQNYEDRAVEILQRVVELTNLHEFATRSVKHARNHCPFQGQVGKGF
jgi:hypothetical protein